MKPLKSICALFLSLSTLLNACGGAPANVAQSSVRRDAKPSVAQNDARALVAGNNAFAFELYRSLRAEKGNLILSPYSISLALAMTYAGARGDTESQMTDALHFTLGQNSHPAFNALDLGLAERGKPKDKDQNPMQLRIANAVWAEQTYPFQQDFLDTLALNYGAGVRLSDFINQFEPARKEINNWVEDQTEDKIKDLLAEGTVNTDTRMVLVNAIYFKADWLQQFEEASTRDSDFHLLGGSTVKVPTMHNDPFIPYAQGGGWQAVNLPYAGDTAAMTILLPAEGNFEAFDSNLDSATLDSILASMQPASVAISLPKFSFTRDFVLADVLAGLGMPDAFTPGLADFSGMTGDRDLFISDVIHKAFVAVDEEGTEASAATAVIMETASAHLADVVFNADRPFIFIIRDTVSGQILFIGRVLNPL